MRKSEMMGWCAGLAVALTPSSPMAQTPPAQNAAPASAPAREPEAIAALERMGASLRKLNSMALTADATTEEVLSTGQKIQYSGTVEIKARKPDRLRVSSKSDRKSRDFFYDGKTLTVFAPNLGYWGTVPAPATIREMVTQAHDKYDIEFPLADLFDLGQDPTLTARLTSAFKVGVEHIGGYPCQQYAMRQPGVDWQIWIREGAEALPCKMVITSTEDPAMPQYVALLKWNNAASVADSDFAFQPPEKARKIVIGSVDAK
ncbi:DUF2092 domain-containing protein [Sphingomonas cavernae]|nr:DUF2092 domain-containing protein [Sphingomonas cavernae]